MQNNKEENKHIVLTLPLLDKQDRSGSRVCGDYILIFREWKRLIDRLTEKNTARWIDGWIDR